MKANPTVQHQSRSAQPSMRTSHIDRLEETALRALLNPKEHAEYVKALGHADERDTDRITAGIRAVRDLLLFDSEEGLQIPTEILAGLAEQLDLIAEVAEKSCMHRAKVMPGASEGHSLTTVQ